jgi:ribosomal protein L12E/L44/L45/RPP1/RPP2
MSDANNEFEDEQIDQPKDPVRAHMRKLEAENKRKDEELATLKSAQRELVFLKAGVNPDDPKAKYFVKGYDGELTVEAIRQAAEEASYIPSQRKEIEEDAQAFGRLNRAATHGETSEPVVDYADKIRNARTPDEVMQLVAQARKELESL